MARVWLYLVILGCVSVASNGHRWWHHPPCTRQDCCWSSWSTWKPCAGDCTQFRFRSIRKQPSCGGTMCSGASYEIRPCPEQCHRGHLPTPEENKDEDHGVSKKTLVIVGSSAAFIILLLSIALIYALMSNKPRGSKLGEKKVVPVNADCPPAYEEKEKY